MDGLCLDEPRFKSRNAKKKHANETRASLEVIDDEELERIQSDVEDDEEGDGGDESAGNEGAIDSGLDDEDLGIESGSSEPLYVLPLYAILSSDKQARVSAARRAELVDQVFP